MKKGKVILQKFSEEGRSLNPDSIASGGMASITNSDMSITSDSSTTVVYKRDSQMAQNMPEREESKGLEEVPIDVMEDDRIYAGNKDLELENGEQMEIKLSDLKIVGALGQGASGFVEKCFHKPT